MTARRAMAIAQSMGFHRLGGRVQYKVLHPETKAYPHFMWFRIVFYDRQMCLLLGMPQGTLDRSMASSAMLAKDSPGGRLERIHCVIASRILERNESDPAGYDYTWTQNLDKELQRSARSLPSRWWLIPNLRGEKNDSQAFLLGNAAIFRTIILLQSSQPASPALHASRLGRAPIRLLPNHLRQRLTRDPVPLHHATPLESSGL
ncbi:hypothetical protein EYZ11_003335 [Aspergillus tanneri]|uniref:Uncharacterized protein n=1 Tax=Aspergillus tanneri TaxID=1220188 RepID=A0A4S3JP08_9EURO|nr:hypothetical protein EYZ11_003335 [Aspergillus tanneri]